ncbi:MAG: hypothetical protein JW807_07575 [Spirochaetes bacterium]|nr:hypothetical protein [Spirochaetota bacterium]
MSYHEGGRLRLTQRRAMGPEANMQIRLNDFVREMAALASRGSHFGTDTGGRYIDPWEMNYRRVGFYANRFVTRDFGDDSCVRIFVPATETGVAPSEGEQPFGWSGKINEHSAELAVWWAFELFSEGEARAFMREQRPAVLFQYMEGGALHEVEARFNGEIWIVEKTSL